jgi:transposase
MAGWRQKVRLLEEQIALLEEQNSVLKELVEGQQRNIGHLETHIEKLEKKLLFYENPHTPPSKSRKKPPRKESNGKLGAPKGHPKYEREEPEPTGSVEYSEDTCPHCNAELDGPFKTDRIIEEEIPEPQPVEVIEHLINHYKCPKCNKHIIAKNNAPLGRFGRNVLTHVTLLKYDDRLPLRKTVSSLERHYNIHITDVGVFKITNSVARKLELPYKELIQRIRNAKVIYADETEIKVDGITYHLWTFVTENEVLFVIRKSRSKSVIEEVLGIKFDGVICSDGWIAYTQYTSNLQRCWAHLLREAKDLAEKYDSFEGFYNSFKRIFEKIKKVREKQLSLKTRTKWKERLKLEMEQIVEQMDSYKEFRKFATTVKNGLEHWFTCLINLLVEPTNNIAERALRELIVQRKIIGGLRREKGAHIMEVITSMIATIKKRELPLFQTIKSCL